MHSRGQSRRSWWRRISRKKKRREQSRWGYQTTGFFRSERRPDVPWRRGRNEHHLTNKCKPGGKGNTRNKLWIRIWRHRNLHTYFGNLKWEVIGDVLCDGSWRKRKKFIYLSEEERRDVLFSIFHKRDPMDCVRVIDRISRAKGRVTRMKVRELIAA